MKKGRFLHKDDPVNIPQGYRIRTISESNTIQYVVEKKFLGFWLRERKPTLNIITYQSAAHYHDHVGRGYDIVVTDGECRTYEDAVEFLHYAPLRLYMINERTQRVYEIWANNNIARNFVGAGTPYKDYHVSRIGIFLTVPENTYFEPKGDYWEEHFSNRYKMYKVVA